MEIPGAFYVLSAFLVAKCQCQCPRIPIKISGFTQDVDRAAGVWYEFMHRNGPLDNNPGGLNAYTNSTILGVYSGNRGTKYHTWYYNFHYPQGFSSLECYGRFLEGNITSRPAERVFNSKFVGFGYGDGKLVLTFTTLFTDYNLVQILYHCNTENTDGVHCDEPHLWIYSRIKPPLLSKVQKSYIKNVADYYLSTVCRTAKDLDLAQWDLEIDDPPCNVAAGTPPLPAGFAAVLREHGVVSSR